MAYDKERQQIQLLEKKIAEFNAMDEINEAQLDVKQAMETECHRLKMELPGERLTVPPNSTFGASNSSSTANSVAVTGQTGRDYRAMFNGGRPGRLDTGDFKDAGEFLRVMESGRYDPRLQIRASMGEGIPSSGGFSVPPQFASEWLDASLPTEIVRNLCRLYPMTSETLDVPGWDGADMSAGATHGGLTMVFMAEGATENPQTAKMRKIQLNAKMAGIYVDASIELIQDGKDFATNLQTALRQSLGYGIDRFCLTGTGAGCPQGVINAPCKIQIEKESGQSSNSLVYENLKKMYSRQLNPGDAVWLFNNTAIPELLEQSIAIGTGGSHVPLLNESNGEFTIFGRPVYFHPAMPTLGDNDDCAFVDFNFYAMGLRSEVWIDQTDAVRWTQRERSFRILMRFDAMCTLDTAITPENGDTLSPIVTLEERA